MPQVLLIEDDEAQRFVAAYALRKAGHAVREAPDGPQGLAAAREARPDVVVCDVMMPGMTGYEVLAELRGDAELAAVPFILLTAMSERKDMRHGMTAGADDYLTKPYRPDELCEAIAAVLARRQVHEEAFRGSISGMVESALEQQKETLGRQYEGHLLREISTRWEQARKAGDLHYQQAFVLLADLFGGATGRHDTDLAEHVRRAQKSARDTLYVFGAAQVLPYGTRLMAVFAAEEASRTTPPELRIVRAAIALAKAAPRERPVSVALHAGPVSLVSLTDGVHGDQGYALVPGPTVHTVAALQEFAAANGWRIATSLGVADLLRDEARFGRRSTTPGNEIAVEITGAAGS